MKKFMMIAVMAVAALTANAQQEKGTFSIAPKVGLSMSTTNIDGAKVKTGFAAGVDATYQITNPFALTAGVFYEQCGWKADDGKAKFDYIAVPILANFYVFKGFAIKAGIQPAFAVNRKAEGKDLKDYTNAFNFAIPVGISYEISNIILDARYNFGVAKFNKDAMGLDDSAYLHNIMITIGYKFNL